MVKLQELKNKSQNKVSFNLSVPLDIVRLLGLKKKDRFAVSFDKDKKKIEYTRIEK